MVSVDGFRLRKKTVRGQFDKRVDVQQLLHSATGKYTFVTYSVHYINYYG